MDDSALVAAMVAGDPRGLEGAYRRYAGPILTFCHSLLRDRHAAADAVHDTFVAANQHAGQLRDPGKLRPWLYAIARNECLRMLRDRSRQASLEEAGEMSAPVTDPGRGMNADEVRGLVWAAADGLNPGDRQVFELMIRHGMSAGEVGDVLGVSSDHAHARLSRAKAQLERALGALLLARTKGDNCRDLAGILRGWDGKLTALLRKRIGRHIESCAVCGEQRRRRVAGLLSGYAGLPLLVPPLDLWDRIRLTSGHASGAGPATAQGRHPGDPGDPGRDPGRHPGWDPDTGFPRPVSDPASTGRRLAMLAAGVVALLLLGLGGVVWTTGPDNVEFNPPPVAAGPAGQSASPSPSAVSPTTSAPTAVPPPATTVAPSPSQSPSEVSPSPSGFPIRVDASAECTDELGEVRSFAVTVSGYAVGVELSAATLHWSPPENSTQTMSINSSKLYTTLQQPSDEPVTWWVEATATDGTTGRTDPVTTPNPCP